MTRAEIGLLMYERACYLQLIGLDADDLKSWLKNWSNLKARAKRFGKDCYLSFEEYTKLAVEAGLTKADQIGIKPGDYQLGRFKDEGGYVMGNCRFIPKEVNLKERWMYSRGRKK